MLGLSQAQKKGWVRPHRVRMEAECDVGATGPELGEACPSSEARRRRLYAEELAFLEREIFACMHRENHLRKLIERESSMYLGGSSEKEVIKAIVRPRPSFCTYYWTARAHQLIRAIKEETPRVLNLLDRRSDLLEKLEDERLSIVHRGDGTKREYECVPASARLLAGRVHQPEQNIGRAPCTDEALAEAMESRFTGLVFRGSHSCVSSDMPGTWLDPSPEAPLADQAQLEVGDFKANAAATRQPCMKKW